MIATRGRSTTRGAPALDKLSTAPLIVSCALNLTDKLEKFVIRTDEGSAIPIAAQAKLLESEFADAVRNKNPEVALGKVIEYRMLGLPIPPVIEFIEAQIAHGAGYDLRAKFALTRLLKHANPSDSHDKNAIELYKVVKSSIDAVRQ